MSENETMVEVTAGHGALRFAPVRPIFSGFANQFCSFQRRYRDRDRDRDSYRRRDRSIDRRDSHRDDDGYRRRDRSRDRRRSRDRDYNRDYRRRSRSRDRDYRSRRDDSRDRARRRTDDSADLKHKSRRYDSRDRARGSDPKSREVRRIISFQITMLILAVRTLNLRRRQDPRTTRKGRSDWPNLRHGSKNRLPRKNESKKKPRLLLDRKPFWTRLIRSLEHPQPLVLPSLLPPKALMPPQRRMLGNSIQRPLPKMQRRLQRHRLFWGRQM